MAVHNPFHHTHESTLAMLLPAAELEVLRILWERGPLTAREIHRAIAQARPLAYTTTLTTCVRLAGKGLLSRSEGRHGVRHLYSPVVDERTFVLGAVKQLLACVARDYPEALTL